MFKGDKTPNFSERKVRHLILAITELYINKFHGKLFKTPKMVVLLKS